MHNRQMDKSIMRVKLSFVVPDFRDILPPFNHAPTTKINCPSTTTSIGSCHGRSPRFVLGRGILRGKGFPKAAPRPPAHARSALEAKACRRRPEGTGSRHPAGGTGGRHHPL